jgi:hypothetical protein
MLRVPIQQQYEAFENKKGEVLDETCHPIALSL